MAKKCVSFDVQIDGNVYTARIDVELETSSTDEHMMLQEAFSVLDDKMKVSFPDKEYKVVFWCWL